MILSCRLVKNTIPLGASNKISRDVLCSTLSFTKVFKRFIIFYNICHKWRWNPFIATRTSLRMQAIKCEIGLEINLLTIF